MTDGSSKKHREFGRICSVAGCSNQEEKPECKQLSFHRFPHISEKSKPADLERRNIWINLHGNDEDFLKTYQFANQDAHRRYGKCFRCYIDISQTSVCRYYRIWVQIMYHFLRELPVPFIRACNLDARVPQLIRERFPNLVCTVDAFEIQIERSSHPETQLCTFSSYKWKNTLKCLVGIAPDGALNFISHAFQGRISDVELVRKSGFLKLLKSDDQVLADRGFQMSNELSELLIEWIVNRILKGPVPISGIVLFSKLIRVLA